MLIDRLEDIKQLLKENNKVFVNDLKKRYGVSEVTIRKDLTILENQGFAKKFHGGAMLKPVLDHSALSLDFYSDKTLNALAELACDEINDGDSIFLGSGRTCCVLARKLSRFDNLTVITNNISALNDLLGKVYKVFLIGGEVTSTDSHTLFSSIQNPVKYFDNIFVNKAFTSASGIDIKAGITVNSIISTYMYKSISETTSNWYIISEFKKFNKISMYPVTPLKKIRCFITDNLSEEYKNFFEENDILFKSAYRKL